MFEEHGVCPMLTLTLFKIFSSKHIWVTTLPISDHVIIWYLRCHFL